MPTIQTWRGYRFFFWTDDKRRIWGGDIDVPPHIHVKKDRAEATIWLSPVAVAKQIEFADIEIHRIVHRVNEQRQEFLGAWNDFLGD